MLSRSVETVNWRRSATDLRWASLMTCVRRSSEHGPVGRSLRILRGGTGAKEAIEEIATKVLRLHPGGLFFGHGGLASENQL